MVDLFAPNPHPKDAKIIDDTPNVVVDEEGFEVARFRFYNDATTYIGIANGNCPCACYSIQGEDG